MAQQLAKSQEQLVLLLFTAIVTYWTRGQVKACLMGSMDSIAARSTKLQAEISNKQFANWLARNEQKLLAQPELRANEPAPLQRLEQQELPEQKLHKIDQPSSMLKPGFTAEDILAIPKGARPDPKTYLIPDYVAQHLAKFENGGSRCYTKSNREKYGIAQRDGTSFIMPSHEANQLLARTAGDKIAVKKNARPS